MADQFAGQPTRQLLVKQDAHESRPSASTAMKAEPANPRDQQLLRAVVEDVHQSGCVEVTGLEFSTEGDGEWTTVETRDGSVYESAAIDMIIDSLQNDVIHELRGEPWPRCPRHQTHPLEFDHDLGLWACPGDPSVVIKVGSVAAR